MSKIRRLSRIFSRDGKSIALAIDHHFFTDRTEGIDEAVEMIPELVENGLNAVLVTPGIAGNYENKLDGVGLLLRTDISCEIFKPTVPSVKGLFKVEEALRFGADGVVCMTFPGTANEYSSCKFAADLASESKLWNIPVMVETLPYSYSVTTEESNSIEAIAAAARLGVELGGDIIKTRLTGKPGDRKIIERIKKPVLALGGPKTNNHLEFFSFIQHCMNIGTKGIAVGRNVWKDENPKRMIAALNNIVHFNGTAEEALEVYSGKVVML